MDLTPLCGEIKRDQDGALRACCLSWFHEGGHASSDNRTWARGASDERGWLAAYPAITRPLTPAEFFHLMHGPAPDAV